MRDESVCQPLSVPQYTQKDPDPSVREQEGKTLVPSALRSIHVVIRRPERRTKKIRSRYVMTPVRVATQGDWA